MLIVALLCSTANNSYAVEEKPQYAIAFFNADWCGPCQTMKITVWADKRVKKVLADNDVQFFSIKDTDREELREYNVGAFPTTILLIADNGNWKEVRRFVGVPSERQVDSMLKMLDGKK